MNYFSFLVFATELFQGFISPEGNKISFEGHSTHSELAMQIVQQNNWFQDFFAKKSDEYISGSLYRYLLKLGWIRVAESQEGYRNALNLEFIVDLSIAKRLVKKAFPSYPGKVNVDFKNVFFSGSMEEFLNWNGREQMFVNKYSKLKKADFGADFQNISDIAPDAGNVYPGRNREIVKQQTDYFPHKTSDNDTDNGEFVHTHPDHCPRPDLRKLKIVDENNEDMEEIDA